jgi:hypothetical protein
MLMMLAFFIGMVQKVLFLVNTGREKFCQAVL